MHHVCHQIIGDVSLRLKADSMHFALTEICAAGASWRQIKAADRSLTPSHSPSQSLPLLTLHFYQCVEKAG